MKSLVMQIRPFDNLIKIFLGNLKFLFFLILIFAYVFCQFFLLNVASTNMRTISWRLRITQLFSKFALWLLDVKVNHQTRSDVCGLIIANHLSYIDILVILSHYPTYFVTSIEMRNSSFLGYICKLATCIFVERRRTHRAPGDIASTIREISKRIAQGHSVCFFPEGTSTNGKTLLPFKSPLFKAAEITKSSVHTFALRYAPSSLKVAAWYGKMNFIPHLYNLCLSDPIEVDLICVSQACLLPNSDLYAFAEMTHLEIRNCLFN